MADRTCTAVSAAAVSPEATTSVDISSATDGVVVALIKLTATWKQRKQCALYEMTVVISCIEAIKWRNCYEEDCN
jgi:hypothetical protein